MTSRQCVRCGDALRPGQYKTEELLCGACAVDLRDVIVSEVAEHLDDGEKNRLVRDALWDNYKYASDKELLTEARELGLLDDDTEDEEEESH